MTYHSHENYCIAKSEENSSIPLAIFCGEDTDGSDNSTENHNESMIDRFNFVYAYCEFE